MTESSSSPSAQGQKSVGGKGLIRGHIMHNLQDPFRDHTGTPALMAYSGTGPPDYEPPPPPFSIQVYVTNGLTAATVGLLPTALRKKIQHATFDCVRLRLDVYFLPPSTSADDCMAHYRAEKKSRADHPPPLVPSYALYDWET